MEEQDNKLQKKLDAIGEEIARASAQAESAQEDKIYISKELLQALASVLRENVGSTEGAGMAASPACTRLVDSAAKLLPRPSDDNIIVWDLTYSNARARTYVDAAGVVDSIRVWATGALHAAVCTSREQAPAPLLVSGLVKTGKSYTLEHVVPAVVAEVLREHQQAEQQAAAGGGTEAPQQLADMVVLRLRGDQLDRSEGAKTMLWSLLQVLLRWARTEHVPMKEGALAAAEADLARPDINGPSDAILDFLKAVKVPVLVLCDEVQSLFLPRLGGKLDAAGAEYSRDTFMKRLLVYGPKTVLWCITGSSMAQTWISIAEMPPNGYAVIASAYRIHLPATYSAAHMDWVWQQLQRDTYPNKPLDRQLLDLCPRSIALLTMLVGAWVDDGRPSDVAAFTSSFMQLKLVDESRREWALGLEAMPVSQRLAVLDLSFPGVGALIDTDLHRGLQQFLLPHVDQKADGRYYLRDSHQRQIIRLSLGKDGKLRESWSKLDFSATITQLDGGWNLLRLGEAADYLFGPNANNRRGQLKEPLAGQAELKSKLQAIADDAANRLRATVTATSGDLWLPLRPPGTAGVAPLGPQELWERQPWFQHVLNSKWNDRDRESYMRNKAARSTDFDMLVFYLRLSRNVLAHMKPWDEEAAETDAAAVDVGVIEALPSVLGQPLFVFNETMVEALQLVSKRTADAAAAKFAGRQSGGAGGGSWNSGTRGAGSTTTRRRGGRSNRGGSGRKHGPAARALLSAADQSAHAHMGPAAAAGTGQHPPPLVHATSGSRGVWRKAEPRAATLAPRLRVRLPLLAPAAAAAAAATASAIRPRWLPCG